MGDSKQGLIGTLFLYIIAFALFFLPVADTDFGWHYRCGKELLTLGKLCLANEYAYFLPSYRWANPYLLYDMSLALTFDRFGFAGVSVLGAMVLATVFGLVFCLTRGPLALRVIALAASGALSWNIVSLGYRAQILGLLFFIGTIWFLEKSKENTRFLWTLPPLFLVWANSHPSVFLGPMMLLLFGVGVYKTRVFTLPYALVLPLSLLATVINPFGLGMYGEILRHVQSTLSSMIAEWVPTTGWQRGTVLIATMSAIVFAIRSRRWGDWRWWVVIMTGLFALAARRNIPMYALSLPVFIFGERLQWNLSVKLLEMVRFVLVILFVFLGAGAVNGIARTWQFDREESVYCKSGQVRLPCEAVSFFSGKTGRVFNAYEWGGFLIWRLPEMKVFVDGRMPAWKDEEGKSPYQVYLEIIQARPGWNERLRALGTDYLLISPGSFLDLELQQGAGWKTLWSERYRDEVAVIYERL